MTTVLDSWAILGYLQSEEPGATQVDDLLESERPVMSWINLGRSSTSFGAATVSQMPGKRCTICGGTITVELPTTDRVVDAARIRSDHAMSYADAFAATRAIACGVVLWTGDPELLVGGSPWRWKDLRSRAPAR